MATRIGTGSEFRQGWPVLLAAFFGVAFGASPIPYNIIGFTVEPLTTEFGWSRTQIMAPITIFGVVAALLAPAFGAMADSFAIGFAAISLTTDSLLVYYSLWLLVGLVGIGSTPVTWSRAINLWFFRQRGLALAILLLGTSLTALIVPHLAVWSIDNFGWRGMFTAAACLSLFIAFPLGIWLFREPRQAEQPPEIQNETGEVTGVTLATALRDYRFWLIWASVMLIATSFGGAFVNTVPILADRGLPASDAASVLTLFGLGILIGRVVTGLLLDRFWAGFVAFPLLCLPAISAWLLLDDSITLLLAGLAGFLLGFAAGAESDLIAYLAGRYFGMAHYGKIYGVLYMPFGIFSAISPLLYAWVRDTAGSYNPMLLATIFTYCGGGFLLLLLGPYPDRFEGHPATAYVAAGADLEP